MKSVLAGLLVCFVSSFTLQAATTAETTAKLSAVRKYFQNEDFDVAHEYLYHWQFGNGSRKRPPKNILSDSKVTSHLTDTIRKEVIATVQTKVKSGKYKPGNSYSLAVASSIAARIIPRYDYDWAIGGCSLETAITVRIEKAKSGSSICKITKWDTVLTDIYKFDKWDTYPVPITLVLPNGTKKVQLMFEYGELNSYGKKVKARDFPVESNRFFTDKAKEDFKVKVP